MKATSPRILFATFLSLVLLSASSGIEGSRAAAGGVPPGAGPEITGIRLEGNSVLVSALVPAGIRKVTLQSSRRLGTGAWEPRAVARLDGMGGEVVFEVPKSPDLEIVRVRADENEALPSSFYRGTNVFNGVAVGTSVGGPGDPVAFGVPGGAVDDRANNNAPEAGPKEVVESDIWKLKGDTLYFFNQYRGLQIIDVSTPDAPVIQGTLPLAAAGEQMYVLADNHVVLLAQNGCNWNAVSGSGSQVLIVAPSTPTPAVVAALKLTGDILESRLVGTALYVMTQQYREVPNAKDGSWEWGTGIYAFDLSDPSAPTERTTLWYSGYGNVLSATDRFLFVSVSDKSQVHCIDISAPDGTMQDAAAVPVAGYVKDKFKIHMDGDVLTVISEDWATSSNRWRPVTTLQTYSLSNPAAPQALGKLKLAEGESLHATRFDDKRVYVVTFLQKDPLWVVDLSDPAHPAIKGELQVPGWSTYIQPLGDRLLAVGIDNTNGWRVAVSLFDVHDPTAPALLSKVPLGENSSWSEANTDEKAFGFLPDAGLILIPFSTYTTNTQQGVQLIDFNGDSLVKRGFISHDVQARRSTVHRDRILSISGEELLSVDAADRDHPQVRSETELAWPVDRVFVQGEYLVEIESSLGWENHDTPALRVVSAADPERVLNRLPLSNLPVAGATYRDGNLYLLQGQTTWVQLVPSDGEKGGADGTNRTELIASIVNLKNAPALEVLGSTQINQDGYFSGSAEGIWAKPDVLVWAAQQMNYWRGWFPVWDVAAGGGISLPVRGAPFLWYPLGGYGESKLFALDIHNPAAPEFVSQVFLNATNGWASFSKPFTADGLVFVSRQETESSITATNYLVYTNTEYVMTTNVVYVTNYTKVPYYTYETNVDSITQLSKVFAGSPLGAGGLATPPNGSAFGGASVLSGGSYHSLALDANGAAWAWGGNGFGQLGDPTSSDRGEAKPISNLGTLRAVASGYFHTLALQSDGTVWACGDDGYGQLGDGKSNPDPDLPPQPEMGSRFPVRVLGLSDAVAIGTGYSHSFAMKADGTLWAWGANGSGQLGAGGKDNQLSPVQVPGLRDVVQITGGQSHTVALTRSGTVWTWGANDDGQLGDRTKVGRAVPAAVPGLDDARAVAAGHSHCLVLRADGTVWAWGLNAMGQLGDGTFESRLEPQPVPGLDRVVAIACGAGHSLALRSDGTVWGWGRNKDGQVNGVASAEISYPVLIAQLQQAGLVAAGMNHSLAGSANGASLFAWGNNDYGQLGNGTALVTTNSFKLTNIVELVTWVEQPEPVLRTNIVRVPQKVTVTNEQPVYTSRQLNYLHVIDYAAPAAPVVRQPVTIPGSLRGLSHEGALLYLVGYKLGTDGMTDFSEWLHVASYDGVSSYLVDSRALPVEWPHPLLVERGAVYVARPESATNGGRALEVWMVDSSGKLQKAGERKLAANASDLAVLSDLLVSREDSGLELFDLTSPVELPLAGSGAPEGCLGWDLSGATGSRDAGVWLPLGSYGIYHIPVTR